MEIISREVLYDIGSIQWDKRILWLKCLWKRAGIVVLFPLLSLTGIGLWTVRIYISWFPFSMGFLMEMLVLKYGLSGLLLFVVGVFPQYLFYIPAYIFLCQNCFLIFRLKKIIKYGEFPTNTRKISHYIRNLILILGVVIIGSAFESYVNPFLMKNFLKLFF